MWIKAFYFRYYLSLKENPLFNVRWEEQEEENDASKCDKNQIQISLTHSTNNTIYNLITITVYISTGRIQIQGKPLKSWGNIEFDILMNMINSADELKQQNSIEKLDQFLDEAKRENENISKREISPANPKTLIKLLAQTHQFNQQLKHST